ncbi:MAG: hypothetical protein GXP41_00410 [Chloroflexi bacterium]|nr:hypothetical protein [Chloroflexota bacterium]
MKGNLIVPIYVDTNALLDLPASIGGRLFSIGLAALPGVVLTLALLWLGVVTPVRADPGPRYVAATGTDVSNNCTASNNPCATIQHAVDVAGAGDEIQVAGGTYSRVGTVAVITKNLQIVGGFDPAFTAPDPNLYETVLDGGWAGSVISISNAGDVFLQYLKITHGDGIGNCQIGTVGGCGGGVFAEGTDLHIAQCFITDNVGSSTKGGLGGGVYVNANGHAVEMWQSQVISNTAAVSSSLSSQYGLGGGVYIGGGTASLRQNRILDNVGSVNHSGSGGIHLQGVTHADILTNTIVNNWGNTNTIWYGGGGGLSIDGYAQEVLVSGNVIEGNWAGGAAGIGGGVYVGASDVHLTRNTIVNNVSGPYFGHGGGLYIQSSTPVTLSNNLIAQNASGSNGGGVYVTMGGAPSSQALLVNNTIADNGDSGVLADRYATVTMTNNLIAGQATGITTTAPAIISADTNLFWNDSDPIVGSNAIQQDPLLTVDYHLRDGSPALDAGITIPWLTTDLEGSPRPQGSGYDIGTFEGRWWALYLPLIRSLDMG